MNSRSLLVKDLNSPWEGDLPELDHVHREALALFPLRHKRGLDLVLDLGPRHEEVDLVLEEDLQLFFDKVVKGSANCRHHEFTLFLRHFVG